MACKQAYRIKLFYRKQPYLGINDTIFGTRHHYETLDLGKVGEFGRVQLPNAKGVCLFMMSPQKRSEM